MLHSVLRLYQIRSWCLLEKKKTERIETDDKLDKKLIIYHETKENLDKTR
ncbi:hypothetical protein [Spiroplasma poulsonii]|nr:hypothetical protein [Spiroplasma poulsonii]UNF61888.1 hypothetical protein MNU24_08220 [Spiroplasma poulsonii]